MAAPEGQAVGRHERRQYVASRSDRAARAGMTLVGPARGTQGNGGRAAQAPQAGVAAAGGDGPRGRPQGRATRSRHAARGGLATWAGRVAAGRAAKVWWAEGAERVPPGPGSGGTSRPAPARRRPPRRHQRHRRHGSGPDSPASAAEGRRASKREDLVPGGARCCWCLGCTWTGWSHGERGGWWADPVARMLYLGFAVTAAWILTRNQRRGAWSLRAVPAGYRLALVGVGLAMVAVAGDTVWHTLVRGQPGAGPADLAVPPGAVRGGVPAGQLGRCGRRGRVRAGAGAGLRVFWPVVLSTTLVVAMTAFFFSSRRWPRPCCRAAPRRARRRRCTSAGLLAAQFAVRGAGAAAPAAWQTPLGTFTVMAGSVALLLATQTGLGLIGLAGAAVLGGAAADVAVTLLRPSPSGAGRPGRWP